MKKQRPVNIYLLTYKYPVTAIISILHRLSGVLSFLLIPFWLWLLDGTLSSPGDFSDAQDFLANPFIKFIVWGLLSALLYHLVAGIRHLLMDVGIGEKLQSARASAWAVFIISGILALVIGVWLW